MTRPSAIVSLDLGNAAMSDAEDVAIALTDIANRIRGGQDSGVTKDLNGNTVGSWAVTYPEAEDDPS